MLFYFGCDMCFPKTFKRFWHDDIDNLILFAEIHTYNAVVMHVDCKGNS